VVTPVSIERVWCADACDWSDVRDFCKDDLLGM
jgi:hypothetical protein